MEFLKVVFILVACYYAFKFGIRLLLPFFMKKMAQKIMNNAQQGNFRPGSGPFQYQDNREQYQSPKGNGKVKVAYVPPKEEPRGGTATAGEFVDFEEVK